MTSASDKPAGKQHYEISDQTLLVESPMVSVVMLAYNHAAYIERAIQSVLAQKTEFAYELLIGEDSSNDGTREIALRYQAAYPSKIRFISAKHNVGMQENGQRLMHACRGEFAAMCEGDDFWNNPEKLQLQVTHLKSHPEVGAIHSDFDHTLFRGGQWRTLRHVHGSSGKRVPQGHVFSALLGGNFIQTCTLCIRTQLVLEYMHSGLPTNRYPVGDWPLSLYVAATSEIAYSPLSLATYRKVPGSAMNSGYAQSLRLATQYEPMINDLCSQFDVTAPVRSAALSSLNKTILSLAFLANDINAFERSWVWLKTNDPQVISPFRRRLLRWIVPRQRMRAVATRLIEAVRSARELKLYRTVQ